MYEIYFWCFCSIEYIHLLTCIFTWKQILAEVHLPLYMISTYSDIFTSIVYICTSKKYISEHLHYKLLLCNGFGTMFVRLARQTNASRFHLRNKDVRLTLIRRLSAHYHNHLITKSFVVSTTDKACESSSRVCLVNQCLLANRGATLVLHDSGCVDIAIVALKFIALFAARCLVLFLIHVIWVLTLQRKFVIHG